MKLVGGVGDVKLIPEVFNSILSLPEFELPLVAPSSVCPTFWLDGGFPTGRLIALGGAPVADEIPMKNPSAFCKVPSSITLLTLE